MSVFHVRGTSRNVYQEDSFSETDRHCAKEFLLKIKYGYYFKNIFCDMKLQCITYYY